MLTGTRRKNARFSLFPNIKNIAVPSTPTFPPPFEDDISAAPLTTADDILPIMEPTPINTNTESTEILLPKIPTSPIGTLFPTSPGLLLPPPREASAPTALKRREVPPPLAPSSWLWRCHHCNIIYRLGCTRRCLECSHEYCTSATSVDNLPPGIKPKPRRRRRRAGGPCAAEFDYLGWGVWGAWRRSVLAERASSSSSALKSSTVNPEKETYAMYRLATSGTWTSYAQFEPLPEPKASGVRDRKEALYVANKHNCWTHCDFPSECHHARYAARLAANARRASAAVLSPAGYTPTLNREDASVGRALSTDDEMELGLPMQGAFELEGGSGTMKAGMETGGEVDLGMLRTGVIEGVAVSSFSPPSSSSSSSGSSEDEDASNKENEPTEYTANRRTRGHQNRHAGSAHKIAQLTGLESFAPFEDAGRSLTTTSHQGRKHSADMPTDRESNDAWDDWWLSSSEEDASDDEASTSSITDDESPAPPRKMDVDVKMSMGKFTEMEMDEEDPDMEMADAVIRDPDMEELMRLRNAFLDTSSGKWD